MRFCACDEWDRLWVQAGIETTWERHPRWMGVFTARYEGHLDGCPWRFYREVFADMVARGILIESLDDHAGFSRYLLARLIPLPTRKGADP
jgi:hypothetical protein